MNDKQRDEEMGLDETTPLMSKKVEEKVLECGGKDTVQFSSPKYFADENDDFVTVDILRMGSMAGRIAASFCTEDCSAMKGKQYRHVSGQVVFEEGQYAATVQVPILDDGEWSATKEFKVKLYEPQNCLVGEHLNFCRVKIMNAEAFPSDVFKDEVHKGLGVIRGINSWSLFFEYCKLNYRAGKQEWQTLVVLVFDQLASLIVFGTLAVGVYLVDVIFARGKARDHLILPSRYQTALIIALWYVVPVLILYAWDAAKAMIDIQGTSRQFLQQSLMRTSMDYTPESRNRVTVADMNVGMGVGAEQIATGYTAALNIVGIIGRIVAIVIFIFVFQHDPLAVHSVVIMVLGVFIFIFIRAGEVQRSQELVEEKWLLMETLVEETHGKYRLLTDYGKRGLMSEMFAQSTEDFSKAKVPDKLVHLNTQYATKLLSGCIIANYIVQRTPDVLSGHVSLGIFLATVTVFSVYLADAVGALNDQLISVIDAFGPLKEFTEYLNLPLELVALKKVNVERRRQTQLKRDTLLASHFAGKSREKQGSNAAADFDVLPIVVSDLNFEYNPGVPVLTNVSISIPQGQMVAVTGPHNSGKNTFMQLLAGMLLPTSGTVFVPSHLRVVHISRDPIFLHATMLHNLALGLADPYNIDKRRAFTVLRMLGLHEAIAMLKAEGISEDDGASDVGSSLSSTASIFMADELQFMDSTETAWERPLNLSFKVKLHIARALIADPEIIILDRTLQALNEESAAQILDVLNQHVQERGLCKPPEGRTTRRPRTVFFGTEMPSQIAKAGCILQMDPKSQSVSMNQKGPGDSRSTSKSETGVIPSESTGGT